MEWTWTTTTPVTDALNSQGDLKPGDEGWWQVWGAQTRDIREGDLVMTKNRDTNEYREYAVIKVIPQDGGMADLCAPRFAVAGEPDKDHDDRVVRFGMLMPLVLLRRGTHHTLADSI